MNYNLKAGFFTSATEADTSTLKIQAQIGRASDAMLSRFIREGVLCVDNAADVVL